MSDDVTAVATRAVRAELGWRDDDGRLWATAFVPLVIDGLVCAALPFAEEQHADRLAAATGATLVFSDSRMARRGWAACRVPVRVDVAADRTGAWTWTGALDQEVRKYPPAQLLIDTAIQRREHWWYVPRWVARLTPRGETVPFPRRGGPDDGVLFAVDANGVSARAVAVDDWTADRIAWTALDAAQRPPVGLAGRALLFTHDFSIPDQERVTALMLEGVLEGTQLVVERRTGHRALGPPRLAQRLADHYRFARACRRALARYDAGASPAAAT